MNTVGKRFVSLVIGILFLVIALLLNGFNLLRVILSILSIIILTYSSQLERTNKKLFVPLFVILFTMFVIALDYLAVGALKKTPIFSYSIVTSDFGTVYNGIGYRVWKCKDNTFKLDPLYKLGYYCKKESMSSENINNVLDTIVDNFDHYKDSYVKIIGRVSEVVDDKTFVMQKFNEDSSLIEYDQTYKLYVEFDVKNDDIEGLSKNSIVTVVGKIYKKDGNSVHMIDSSFIAESTSSGDVVFDSESNIYCEYDKELWFQTENNIFYKSCINNVNITIDGNQYSLEKAIEEGMITLEDIENEAQGYQMQSKDYSRMYKFNDFNILVCDPNVSRDVIVGRTVMDFSDGYCNVSNG